jgi:hypothetical protein
MLGHAVGISQKEFLPNISQGDTFKNVVRPFPNLSLRFVMDIVVSFTLPQFDVCHNAIRQVSSHDCSETTGNQ